MTGPRVLPLTPEEAAPEVRPIFETYMKERGNIPNMDAVQGHGIFQPLQQQFTGGTDQVRGWNR